MYRLKENQPPFTVMAEGPWENKAYRRKEIYQEIPPQYADRFQEIEEVSKFQGFKVSETPETPETAPPGGEA